jgi:hypothetical protein
MPRPETPQEQRSVKGSVIVDYLKIIRANPDLPWAEHLTPQDLSTLDQMVLPASWYPLDMYQRMGMAIFKLVSGEKYEVVQAFGRSVADRMAAQTPGLVAKGSARDTLKKFLAVQDRLYSFKLFESEDLVPGRVILIQNTLPRDQGGRLLMEVLTGNAGRLIELSGGLNVRTRVLEAMWEGGRRNRIELAWDE